MDIVNIRKHYTEHQRRALTVPGFRREDVQPVVRMVNENAPHSFISYSALTPGILADTVEREMLYFKMIGHNVEWTVYDYDQPPDLREQLQAHGFVIGEEEAVLILDVDDLPASLQHPTAHDVREVTEPSAITKVLETVQRHAFGEKHWVDDALEARKRTAPDSLAFFASYVDDAPVSAGWLQIDPTGNPFAGMYGGATIEAERGKGHYGALVKARAALAQARGIRYLHVDAGPMSRPILEKIGFSLLALAWPVEYKVTQAET
jgi:hypothetical protein